MIIILIPIIVTIIIIIIRWHARQNWVKLRDSQIVISTYWKRWKDKSLITELEILTIIIIIIITIIILTIIIIIIRWKDKSHITELKMRRKQEWAVVIVQKHYRRWQVGPGGP